MKRYFFLFLTIHFAYCCFAQSWQFQLEDDYFNWFYRHQMQFKVGDELPGFKEYGIYLEEAEYIIRPRIKFTNSTNGKLIIFDFWNTWCSDCIARFPELEEIQKKYQSKIQIFLVNSWETTKEIQKKLKKKGRQNYSIRLPNLPSITDVSAMRLFNLFPSRGVPHHVWVDKNKIVRLIGPAENTHSQKIESLLSGNDIVYLTHNATTPNFNKNYPYYKILGKELHSDKPNTFITKFNNEYASRDDKFIEGVIDSIGHTIRDTYINLEVLEILRQLFANSLKKSIDNTIYQNSMSIAYCILNVKDTLRYTHQFIPYIKLTDEQYIKSRICYEQILPDNVSKEDRKDYMLDQLGSYLFAAYSTQVKVEKRTTPCYVLQRTSTIDKLASKSKDMIKETVSINGVEMINYKGFPSLNDVVRMTLGNMTIIESGSQELLLLDELNYKGKVDVSFPAKINSIEELRAALKPFDLDVLKTERELEFLVISEVAK